MIKLATFVVALAIVFLLFGTAPAYCQTSPGRYPSYINKKTVPERLARDRYYAHLDQTIPGRPSLERYRAQLEQDPVLANTLDEIFAHAEEWHRTGGASNPANRRAARQATSNATAPPIQYSPNPDPDPFIIPPGAQTIVVGRTWPQSVGNPETPYGFLAEQGFRTFERIFNSNGGMMFQGQPTYLKYATYNDGGDCNLMLILYQRLIIVDGAVFLQTPVHFECSLVVLVAEAYRVPMINTCDHTLPYLMDIDPTYMNLQWLWDLTSNLRTAGESCVKPLYDQGARSLVSFEVPESPFFADQAIIAAQALNMTVPFPKTVFSIAEAIASYSDRENKHNCSYYDPFIDQLIAADPDILYGSALTETEQLMTCIFRRKYRPRGLVIIVGMPPPGSPNYWKAVGMLVSNTWVNNGDYSDPFVTSSSYYADVFDQMWNTTERSLGYQASHGIGTGLGLYCIREVNSTDPALIGACLTSLNISTVLGQIHLINGTRHYLRPYICQQVVDINNTINIVYPADYELVTTAVYPWDIENFFPQEFLDSLVEHTGLSKRDVTLIIVFVVFFGVLIIVIPAAVVFFRAKYHTVIIEKGKTRGGGSWNDENSSQREGGTLGRVFPCVRF